MFINTEVLQKLNNLEQALTNQLLFTKPVLNLREASRYMGVSESFLYKLTSARSIAHSRPNGKLIFFNREELDAWMQSNPQRTRSEISRETVKSLAKEGGQKNG